MGVRGVLWDMDGVLVDTGEFHYQAWDETLKSNNIPFSHELFQQTFGMNNWGVLTTLMGYRPDQSLYASLSDKKEKLFRDLIQGRVSPLPGVLKTLKFLKSKNIHQAVASSAPLENIDTILDTLNLQTMFDAVLSGSLLMGKPAPDIFLEAARAIDIQPQNCLVIEDSIAGVEAAKRAGMLCIAVTNTNQADKLGLADYILDSLLQIKPGFLEGILEFPAGTPEKE